MGATERQQKLLRILCRRRHDTMANLAAELGVSIRTIRRDIETLSLSEPIYTLTGRYYGGVYIADHYRADRIHLTDNQYMVLNKVLHFLEKDGQCPFSSEEMVSLRSILIDYGKQ